MEKVVWGHHLEEVQQEDQNLPLEGECDLEAQYCGDIRGDVEKIEGESVAS